METLESPYCTLSASKEFFPENPPFFTVPSIMTEPRSIVIRFPSRSPISRRERVKEEVNAICCLFPFTAVDTRTSKGLSGVYGPSLAMDIDPSPLTDQPWVEKKSMRAFIPLRATGEDSNPPSFTWREPEM